MSELRAIESIDGTKIAYEQEGDGPPLVLIHGGGGVTRSYWDRIRPLLAGDATLIIPDRRGRGDSGDTDDYSFEKEIADICALANTVDENPVLFGHSFGGLCAMEAAQRASVEGLILYEPALLTGEHRHDASLAAQMDELLEAGERHQAAKLFFQVATNTENVEDLKMWPDCVDLTETIARESRAVEQYRLEDTLDFHAPTLLLMSENGPRNLRDGVQTLHDALGDGRLVELTGIGHGGISTNPTQVAHEVQKFMLKLAE